MIEDVLIRKGTVILQSCTVSLVDVPGSNLETSITSSDGVCEVISIKVEEVPEPISFPVIKVEPDEVSYLSV
jgi:proline racemase